MIYFQVKNGGQIWDDTYLFFGKSWFFRDTGFWYFWINFFRWPLFNSILHVLYKNVGMEYVYYHSINMFFHAFNCFLLWYVARKFTKRYAYIIALIYLVHPMNVQNVAWMIQLKSLLSLNFIILSFIAFDLYLNKNKKYAIFLSTFFYLCSLLTKSFLLHFPFYLVLYLIWKKTIKSQWTKTLPVFGVMIFYMPYFVFGSYNAQIDSTVKNDPRYTAPNIKKILENTKKQERIKLEEKLEQNFIDLKNNENEEEIEQDVSLDQSSIQRTPKEKQEMIKVFYDSHMKRVYEKENYLFIKILTMSQTFYYYIYKMLMPYPMAGFYKKFNKEKSLLNIFVVITFIFLILAVYIFGLRRLLGNNIPDWVFLTAALVASYLPISGIIRAPFMNITDVSDHHMLYCIPFYFGLVILILKKMTKSFKINSAIFAIIILTYSGHSFSYAKTFKNAAEFYKKVIKVDPTNMVGYLNLGHYLKMRKLYNASRSVFYQGYLVYRRENPLKVKYAIVPKNLMQLSFTSMDYFKHPILDPYYLLILRHLASFKQQKTNQIPKNRGINP